MMASTEELEAVRVAAQALLQVSSRLNSVKFTWSASTKDGASSQQQQQQKKSSSHRRNKDARNDGDENDGEQQEELPFVTLPDAAGFLSLLSDVLPGAVQRCRAEESDQGDALGATADVLSELLLRAQPQLIAVVVSLLQAPQIMTGTEDELGQVVYHALVFFQTLLASLWREEEVSGASHSSRIASPHHNVRSWNRRDASPSAAGEDDERDDRAAGKNKFKDPRALLAYYSEVVEGIEGRPSKGNGSEESDDGRHSLLLLSQTVYDLLHRVGLVPLLVNLMHQEYPIEIRQLSGEVLFMLLVRSYQARDTVASSDVLLVLHGIMLNAKDAKEHMSPRGDGSKSARSQNAGDDIRVLAYASGQQGHNQIAMLRALVAACLREVAETHAASLGDVETMDMLLRLLAMDSSNDVRGLAAETLEVIFINCGTELWRSCLRKKEIASVCADRLERDMSATTLFYSKSSGGSHNKSRAKTSSSVVALSPAVSGTISEVECIQATLKLVSTLLVLDSRISRETVAKDSTFAEYLLALFMDRTLVFAIADASSKLQDITMDESDAEYKGSEGYRSPRQRKRVTGLLCSYVSCCCHAARCLRYLVQLAPYYRYIAFDLFSHSGCLLALLQGVIALQTVPGSYGGASSPVVHHFPDPHSAASVSPTLMQALTQTLKIELALTIGLCIAQDPRCRQLLFSELQPSSNNNNNNRSHRGRSGSTVSVSSSSSEDVAEVLRNALLSYMNAAALDYFTGISIVDVTGVELNALESVEWESPDRPSRDAIHAALSVQEERWNRWDDAAFRETVVNNEKDRAYLEESEAARLATIAAMDGLAEVQQRRIREEQQRRVTRKDRLTFILVSFALHSSLRSADSEAETESTELRVARDTAREHDEIHRQREPQRPLRQVLRDELRSHGPVSPPQTPSGAPRPQEVNETRASHQARSPRSPIPRPYSSGEHEERRGDDAPQAAVAAASSPSQRHQPDIVAQGLAEQQPRSARGGGVGVASPNRQSVAGPQYSENRSESGHPRIGSSGLLHSQNETSEPQPDIRHAADGTNAVGAQSGTSFGAHSARTDNVTANERDSLMRLMDPSERQMLTKFESALKLFTTFAKHYQSPEQAAAQREFLRKPVVYESVKGGMVRRKTPLDANEELQRLARKHGNSRRGQNYDDEYDQEGMNSDEDAEDTATPSEDSNTRDMRRREHGWNDEFAVAEEKSSAAESRRVPKKHTGPNYVANLGLVGPNTKAWSVDELRKGDLFYFHIPFLDINEDALTHVRSRAIQHLHALKKQFLITPNAAKARRWFLYDAVTHILPGVVHSLSVLIELIRLHGLEEVKFPILIFHRDAHERRRQAEMERHQELSPRDPSGRTTYRSAAAADPIQQAHDAASIHSGNLGETVDQVVFYFKQLQQKSTSAVASPLSPYSPPPATPHLHSPASPFGMGDVPDDVPMRRLGIGAVPGNPREDLQGMPAYTSPRTQQSSFLKDLDARIHRLVATQFTGLEAEDQARHVVSRKEKGAPASRTKAENVSDNDSDFDERRYL